jgi:hypothetical protein
LTAALPGFIIRFLLLVDACFRKEDLPMRKAILIAALVAGVFALLMIGACGKKTETAQGSAADTAQAPVVTVGHVFVDDDVLAGFVDETNHHFGLARKAFVEKDYATASAELLKCAGFVKLETTRASGEDRRMLEDAVIRLAELADAIKGGTIASVEKLDSAYAHAELALAYHHQVKAEELWKEANPKAAGHDLKAASMHLENSMQYADEKAEADTKAVIKDADDLGQKLVEGTAIAADKVGKAMQDLGAKIEEWGQKSMPPKK